MRGKNNTGIGLWTQYELAERSFFFPIGKEGKGKMAYLEKVARE